MIFDILATLSSNYLALKLVSSHVAAGRVNLATGDFSRNFIVVESSNELQCIHHISLNCDDSKDCIVTTVAKTCYIYNH
jgi:hypothetical protein